MELPKKDEGDVVFPFVGNGKVLELVRGTTGAKLERSKTLTTNTTVGKQQQVKATNGFMMEKISSGRIEGPMTFQALTVGFFRTTNFNAGGLKEGYSIRCSGAAIKTVCQNAGIQGFRFHDFRHTAIPKRRQAGIDHWTLLHKSEYEDYGQFYPVQQLPRA